MTQGAYVRCSKYGCKKKVLSNGLCRDHTAAEPVKQRAVKPRPSVTSDHNRIDAHIRNVVIQTLKECGIDVS